MEDTPPRSRPSRELRVRCFATGSVRNKRGRRGIRRYLLDDWSERALPVNVFLVEHPDGLCLFDTGQSARATRAGYFPWWHPFFRLSRFELTADDEIDAQLRAGGVDPRSLRWIVLSHLHTDHVGGLPRLPCGKVIVARTEWKHANGVAGRMRGYVPQHWPAGRTPSVVDLDGPPVGPFTASYDIAGDGVLLLVPTPGHTPGHCALLVRGSQRWLLGGDLTHTAAELDLVAPDVARYCRTENVNYVSSHDPHAERILAGIP